MGNVYNTRVTKLLDETVTLTSQLHGT